MLRNHIIYDYVSYRTHSTHTHTHSLTHTLTHMHTLTLHTKACPFNLEVFTEDCEGEIEIVDLLPFNPIVNPALCRLVMERGVCGEVRDGSGDLFIYTFTTPHLTTIATENKVKLLIGFMYTHVYQYTAYQEYSSSASRWSEMGCV